MSIILVVFGVLFIYLSNKEYEKDKTYSDIKDNLVEKYKKLQWIIDLIEGLSYAITGILLFLNIISGKHIVFIIIMFIVLIKIIKFIVNIKTKKWFNENLK